MAEGAEVQIVLKSGSVTAPASVQELSDSFGASLSPLFPGADDPSMSVYWLAEPPENRTAEYLDALLALPEVDGAYVKPPESAP